jgi:DNA repair protein RecO (recombination protein O)
MANMYTTRALVLRRFDIREADRLVVLYTSEYGKIEATVQGGSKIISKLASHLEPYSVSRVTIVPTRRGERVTGAELLKYYPRITTSIRIKAYADLVNELADRLTRTRLPDMAIWRLIGQTWAALDRQSVGSAEEERKALLIVTAYLLKLLTLLGYGLDLEHCQHCGRTLVAAGNRLSLERGGAICSTCQRLVPDWGGQTVPVTLFKLLRYLIRESYTKISAVATTVSQARHLGDWRDTVIHHHLEQELKSLLFLRVMTKAKMPS